MEKMLFLFDFGTYYVNNCLGNKLSVLLMGVFLWLSNLSPSIPKIEHRYPEMTQAKHDKVGSKSMWQFGFYTAT